jgi:hypothetical protein
MRDFLDVLKKTYIICGATALFVVFGFAPVVFAIKLNPWWAVAELVTAPLGIAVVAWAFNYSENW